MVVKLPTILRSGASLRGFCPGVDLPCWFYEGIKAVDSNLYFVWHHWRVLYDDVMNQYTGSLDDPRFNIVWKPEYGNEEIWGYPLTDNEGNPIPENRWHIWRLCDPHGWCHVCDVKDTDAKYLSKLLSLIHI